jgi:simple sugar transport system permease protein
MGSELRLSLGLSSGIGFTAIVVALLGRLHPLGIMLAAALLSALTLGGHALQRTQEIPASVGTVVNAVMVLLVLLANRHLERRL